MTEFLINYKMELSIIFLLIFFIILFLINLYSKQKDLKKETQIRENIKFKICKSDLTNYDLVTGFYKNHEFSELFETTSLNSLKKSKNKIIEKILILEIS